MEEQHKVTGKGLAAAIIGFMRFLRTQGFNVGIPESFDALEAVRLDLMGHPRNFQYALKAVCCCTGEDYQSFDRWFDEYWKDRRPIQMGTVRRKGPIGQFQKAPATAVLLGHGHSSAEEEASSVSGANATERLRYTDFSKVADTDSQLLEEVAVRLWQEMGRRLRRRLKASRQESRVDIRKTIRQSTQTGGEPLDLYWRARQPRKQRLVLLLDVSGSMDKYSFYLLRFIYILKTYFQKIEAFTFSTRLARITELLDHRSLELSLRQLTSKADNWSSGTRIGECFKMFNDQYAKTLLNGQTTVIILSDGLDTGEPDQLAHEMERIKKRTRQLIWLNPLKGTRSYQPTARGMSAAMSQIDVFHSAHNLNSLLDLEKFLAHV